jgi:hypothetical protein
VVSQALIGGDRLEGLGDGSVYDLLESSAHVAINTGS